MNKRTDMNKPTAGGLALLVLATTLAATVGLGTPAQARTKPTTSQSLSVTPFACGDDEAVIAIAPCMGHEGILGGNMIIASVDGSSSEAGYLVSAQQPFAATSIDITVFAMPIYHFNDPIQNYNNIYVDLWMAPPHPSGVMDPPPPHPIHFAGLPFKTLALCEGNFQVATLNLQQLGITGDIYKVKVYAQGIPPLPPQLPGGPGNSGGFFDTFGQISFNLPGGAAIQPGTLSYQTTGCPGW
jgi:hypothetical protein